MEIDTQLSISVEIPLPLAAYWLSLAWSHKVTSLQTELLPLEWISSSIHAARLYVSAYFRPLLKTVTQTESQPYIYDSSTEIMVAYDNAESFGMMFLFKLYVLF